MQANKAPSGGDGSAVHPEAVAAVGDSLPHDILGALRTEISSVFIAGGVHFEELGVRQGCDDAPSEAAYTAVFSNHLEGGSVPTHVTPSFKW